MATCSSVLPWITDGPRSLAGYSPWGHKSVRHNLRDWATTVRTHTKEQDRTKACLKSDFMGIIKSQKVSHEWVRPKLFISPPHIGFDCYPCLPIPRMWKSITLSRPYGVGFPKSPDPKNVLKAQNQIEAFELCFKEVKANHNQILDSKFWKMSIQFEGYRSEFIF